MDVIIPRFPPQSEKGWWDKMYRQLIHGVGLERLSERKAIAATAAIERKTERKTVDGLGQLKAQIPELTYLRWHQSHPGCWSNQEFKREFYRDNPEVLAARPVKKYY